MTLQHTYLESGWCSCGHHREDGRRETTEVEPLSRSEIQAILGPTYQPKDKKP